MKRFRIPLHWPFYLLALPVFFVWHKLNENFGLIPVSIGLQLTLEYWIILTILFACWFLALFKTKYSSRSQKWRAAGIVTGITGTLYLFWGAIHDFLKMVFFSGFFSSYGFLLIFLPILLIIGIGLLRKYRPPLLQTTRFLNLLLLLLLSMEGGLSLFYSLTGQKEKGQLSYKLVPALDRPISNSIAKDSLPDIFFIIWDEYASSRSLLEHQKYDNSHLDSLLRTRGFYIAPESMSNYNSTPHSLASMFNLDYFPVSLEDAASDSPGLLRAQEALKNALLPRWLAEQGYSIVNLGLMDLWNHPSPFEPYFNRDQRNTILHENMSKRIHAEIWWKVVTWFPSLNWSRDDWKISQAKDIEVFRTNWDSLQTEWKSSDPKPKMVFAHFKIPHIPFHFNRRGERRDIGYLDRSSMLDSLYVDQLIYINSLIDTLTRTEYDSSSRSRVVVIMGDHGFRDNEIHPAKRKRNKQFENLTAIYYSDRNYQALYSSISPVNQTRMLVNKYFGFQLKLLADSTIMIR